MIRRSPVTVSCDHSHARLRHHSAIMIVGALRRVRRRALDSCNDLLPRAFVWAEPVGLEF